MAFRTEIHAWTVLVLESDEAIRGHERVKGIFQGTNPMLCRSNSALGKIVKLEGSSGSVAVTASNAAASSALVWLRSAFMGAKRAT